MFTLQSGPYKLRGADPNDAAKVGLNLRAMDSLDLAATTLEPALSIISRNIALGRRTFSIDNARECIAVGGVLDVAAQGRSVVWLLGTPSFDKALRSGGARLCQPWLNAVAEGRSKLFNVVPESNTGTVRWLEWLGFRPVTRFPNYRGLGADCVEMELSRG